jgi:hypothetical protein
VEAGAARANFADRSINKSFYYNNNKKAFANEIKHNQQRLPIYQPYGRITRSQVEVFINFESKLQKCNHLTRPT